MKRLLILCFFSISIYSYSQIDTLFVNNNKFIRLQFNSEIKFFQVSNPNLFYIESKGQFLFIQSLLTDVEESNLFVDTADEVIYDFILNYKSDISKVNYSYVTKDLNKQLNEKNYLKSDIKIPIKNPINSKGFIKTRNFVENTNIMLSLKGVYIEEDFLYFQFLINNNSNINYNLSSFKFFIVNQTKLKNASIEKEELYPVHIYENWDLLKGKESKSFVVVFKKFTLSNRNLLFEVLENNGDRNLELNINYKFIQNARSF